MVGYLYEELPQQDVHLGRVLSKSPAAKLKVKVEGIKKEINFVRRFGWGFSMFFKTNQREARSFEVGQTDNPNLSQSLVKVVRMVLIQDWVQQHFRRF